MVLFATVAVFLVCHACRFVETGMIIWNPITKFQSEHCGNLSRYGTISTNSKTIHHPMLINYKFKLKLFKMKKYYAIIAAAM